MYNLYSQKCKDALAAKPYNIKQATSVVKYLNLADKLETLSPRGGSNGVSNENILCDSMFLLYGWAGQGIQNLSACCKQPTHCLAQPASHSPAATYFN